MVLMNHSNQDVSTTCGFMPACEYIYVPRLLVEAKEVMTKLAAKTMVVNGHSELTIAIKIRINVGINVVAGAVAMNYYDR